MKENSQTQFAILGLLQLGPMSGYDLKGMVDESIGHFWREGWGRIYPTLHGLERAGMVAKRAEKKTEKKTGKKTGEKRGPERNVYTLRPAGRKRLREWLSRDWTPEVYRNEMLLKVFFGHNATPGVTRRHVERFSAQCVTEIATYEQILKAIEGECARNHPDAPYWKMTVNYGLHHSRALKEWAEETLAGLDGLTKETGTAAK